MDLQVQRHAEILASHSTDIQDGDAVLIIAPSAADELVIALYEEIAARGATAMTITNDPRFERAFLQNTETFTTEPHVLAALEHSDVVITIRGAQNNAELSEIPPETQTAYEAIQQPIQEERLSTRWVTTQFPMPADAQTASMSTEAHKTFVWNAINRDWDEQGRHQEQLVDLLESTSTVRIVSGDETDLVMSVDGMEVVNDFGQHNMPGGEVSTAPVVESVTGTVLFDKPLLAHGREINDVWLTFENGEVVEYSTAQHRDVLTAVLGMDVGARRIGELGIGMNRDIDRFTYNMLFDEKMGDTVHLALGRAYEQTVGPNRTRNESAIHMDMIVDMSSNSFIEFDDEVVQRNGMFVFEDGFDG